MGLFVNDCKRNKRKYIKSFCFIFLFSLVGCLGSDESILESGNENNTNKAINALVSTTTTGDDVEIANQDTNSTDLCAYVWTSRTLPELSAQLQDDFIIKGFENIKINAEAYGENCIDPKTNKVKYFTAMQTDFHITLSVSDLSDDVIGNYLFEIIDLLSEYPEESLPGSMPGHIGVRFGKASEDRFFWFEINKGLEAVDKGYKGRTLVNVLEDKR